MAVVVAAVAAECQAAVSRGAEWPRVAFHVAECHRAAFLVPEWPRAALVLPVLTGTVAARGTAVTTGAVRTGTAVIGTTIGEIRTVDGAGGTATSGASPGTTSYSSVVLVFHGGGAGAGALGQAGAGAAAGAGVAATVTTGAVIRTTVAAMAIPITATAMDMATDTVPRCSTEGTETAANPESLNCSAVFHALVTIMDPSTESWGRKLGAQSGTTSKNRVT